MLETAWYVSLGLWVLTGIGLSLTITWFVGLNVSRRYALVTSGLVLLLGVGWTYLLHWAFRAGGLWQVYACLWVWGCLAGLPLNWVRLRGLP